MLSATSAKKNSMVTSQARRWLRWTCAGLLVLIMGMNGDLRAAEDGYVLRAVRQTNFAGDRVDVILEFAGEVPTPSSFVIDNPARLTLDLPATRNQASADQRQPGTGIVQGITTAEANHHTRVVINLPKLVPYTTRTEGNRLIVSLNTPAAPAPLGPPPSPASSKRSTFTAASMARLWCRCACPTRAP